MCQTHTNSGRLEVLDCQGLLIGLMGMHVELLEGLKVVFG